MMQVEVKEIHEDYNYKNFFKIIRARLCHEKFDGSMSPEIERLVFERGNSVGVLFYDAAEDVVILTKQFRYPAYLHNGPGWLLEIVAGVLDKGRDMLSVAQSELLEEIGYQADSLQFLCHFYLSPGGSSEQMSLYLGYAHHAERVHDGGGLISEHEDIQVVTLKFQDALDMIFRGEISDAKTIIALQHLSLLQQRKLSPLERSSKAL